MDTCTVGYSGAAVRLQELISLTIHEMRQSVTVCSLLPSSCLTDFTVKISEVFLFPVQLPGINQHLSQGSKPQFTGHRSGREQSIVRHSDPTTSHQSVMFKKVVAIYGYI